MNTSSLRVNKISIKKSSDEIIQAGDCAVIDNLYLNDGKAIDSALVIRCPFCRMDMASTSFHKVIRIGSWFRRLCGLPNTISVTPMLQCPYVPSHKFKITKGKILPM